MEKRTEMNRSRTCTTVYTYVLTGIVLSAVATAALLEIQRRHEMSEVIQRINDLVFENNQLKSTLDGLQLTNTKLQEETKELRTELNVLAEQITKELQARPSTVDDYDDYEDEYDHVGGFDEEPAPKEGAGRTSSQSKRDMRRRRSILDPYRVKITMHKNRPIENPSEIQSRIFIEKSSYQGLESPPALRVSSPGDRPLRHQPGKGKKKHGKWDNEHFDLTGDAPVAIHFGGDTSGYTSSVKHYDIHNSEGNHRMYHPDGIFKDWTPSNWVGEIEADKNFVMNKGELTVEQSGLYFVYAQVFYADVHDTSGFRVYRNDIPRLQCTTTTLGEGDVANHYRRNSCFTGGLMWINSGDRISLKEIEGDRYTVFEHSKSFFGLFKVSCCAK